MIMTTLQLLLISLVGGTVGAILGLGGGIIITPALTLLFDVDIRYAIGASIISVIATSSGSAIAYLRDRLTNLRVGMFLEVATTIGAVTGAFVASLIAPNVLFILFGLLLLNSAYGMVKKVNTELPENAKTHPLAAKLRMNGSYYDKALGRQVDYQVANVYGGFGVMYAAGVISGLLGIGSGSFKVMAMDVFMKLPLKVSSATSNFMMGVTAAASAGIYFFRGDIDPSIAAPVAIGVLAGSTLGARLMQKLKSRTIRLLFIPILGYVAIEMILQGVGWI
ncbi:sulfite exporter TauE/SafE family protein [Paenibacillus dendritiformis]|uniref:sulfite exporter TauE/SafE family protein n=1 Tax=Paenibacillus dendritiformis TaxID=130049 RepID=UPI00248CE332|nr:sulfite exporter TauE/SafE family protein [Paenibacillus dendritiformis]WGU93530.1 sulfite exporter TauE/SafE family protein [Paenibacillus dendritiformis]